MSDTNGTVTNRLPGTGDGDEGTAKGKRGGSGKKPAPSKLERLYALAGRGTKKTFTLTRTVDGVNVAMRIDGHPETYDQDGVEALATELGAKMTFTVSVGEGKGRTGCNLSGDDAAEGVQELVG